MHTTPPTIETLHRRWIGAVGLVLFAAVAVVFPLSHAIEHREDHAHGLAGAVTQALGRTAQKGAPQRQDRSPRPGEHRHRDTGQIHADHDHHPYDRASEQQHEHEPSSPNPHHGQGSLQHLGLALLCPALFLVPPSFAVIERTPPPETTTAEFTREPWTPRQPRAPPV